MGLLARMNFIISNEVVKVPAFGSNKKPDSKLFKALQHDLAIIATGECVYPALLAAKKLEEGHGLKVRVISMHTIKPLDSEVLMEAASECRGIITVEEHSVHGGLGEGCAACLLQNGYAKPFRIIGIPDEYTVSGSQAEIFNHYGISGEGIAKTAMSIINTQ